MTFTASDDAALQDHNTAREAAALLDEAERVVEPFAACVEQISSDEDDEEWAKFRLLIRNYRAAAGFLAKLKEQPNGND